MVKQFLRLKLRLLGNAFARGPWHVVGMIVALVYGLGLAAVVIAGLIDLRSADSDVARSITVVVGSSVVLGFILLPLAFGADDAIDPRRFVLFGIPSGQLSSGLALAALVSVPSLVITVVALAQIITWSRGILPTFLAIVAAVLIVATCVLAARVSTAIASFLISSRRARDATGIAGVIGLVALAVVFALLATVDWAWKGLDALARVAQIVSWTPLGAVWAVPADAAEGAVDTAVLKLLIAVAFVGLLWLAWRVLIAAMLVRPQRPSRVRIRSGLGWFDRFVGRPTGVIAARSMTYWMRDSRYWVSLIIIPLVPIVPVIALATAGVDARVLALIPVPIMCVFLAWSTLHNDLAYDSTAVWIHVASNTSGRQDRWGRAIPVLIFGVPLVVIGSVVSVWLWGDWDWLPSVAGFSLCILLVGVGLSSVVSARFPYPVVKPGDSAFAQPQSSGTASSIIQSLSLIALLLFALPVAAFAALGYFFGYEWHLAALAAGVVIGVGSLLGGVRWGGRIFDRRAPELLEFTLQN